MYSFMGSLYLDASINSCLGRYGNASLMFNAVCWNLGVSLLGKYAKYDWVL